MLRKIFADAAIIGEWQRIISMDLSKFFSIWERLSVQEQQLLTNEAKQHNASKGSILHNGNADCTGLILVVSGQLRAFILSEDGREITLYRLLDRDICLFSASCIMHSIQFDINIKAEKDTEYLIIPADIYRKMMEVSAPISNFTNDLMANRFSEVMWLIEQIMWKSFDKRLAEFLLEESALEDSNQLKITHEAIGNHLGNPREVVTRMLRYFQSEGMVKLSRGTVELTDKQKLRVLLST